MMAASPIVALPVPRAALAAGKPTKVSAPLQLASYSRDATGRLHFPGTKHLRRFRKVDPPRDLNEGIESFVDKDDEAGSSIDPIVQGELVHLRCLGASGCGDG